MIYMWKGLAVIGLLNSQSVLHSEIISWGPKVCQEVGSKPSPSYKE